eukprot:391904_1
MAGLGAMNTNTVVLPLCATQRNAAQRKVMFDSAKWMKHSQYMQLLTDIVLMEKNVIITHNFEHFNYNLIVSKPIQNHFNMTPVDSPALLSYQSKNKRRKIMLPITRDKKWVDVWLFVDRYSFEMDDIRSKGNGDGAFPMLMMQFALILSINKIWRTNANIRVLLLVQKQQCDVHGSWLNTKKEEKFYQMLETLRLIDYIQKIETVVLCMNESYSFQDKRWFDDSGITVSEYMTSGDDDESANDDSAAYAVYDDSVIQQRIGKYYSEINEIIQYNSNETYFTFIALPDFDMKGSYDGDASDVSSLYIQCLHILTHNLPP